MVRRSLVVALLLVPALLLGQSELNSRLQRIFASPAFTEQRYGPIRWLRGGAAFTTLEDSAAIPGAREIVEHNTATGQRQILISAAQLKPTPEAKPLTLDDYAWDQDLRRLLIFTESRRVWRTNTKGDYWVLDRQAKTLKKLGGDAPASSLMFAKFSPDGTQAAYVRANNLYVETLATGEIRRLTSDGSANIINGTSDWVYEEELNLRDAFRWSPDGRHLAFWRFDQTGAQQFALVNNTDSLYPRITNIPYPKAGTRNAEARIGVIAATGGEPRWMELPGDPREHYVFRVDWVDAQSLAIGQLNRKQNQAIVFLAAAASGQARPVFRDEDAAWVDVREGQGTRFTTGRFDWLRGGRSFAWPSERDGERRVYRVGLDGTAQATEPVPLTPAALDIVGVKAFDPESRWMYFTAAPGNATQRYLYRIALGESAAVPVRLTPAGLPGTHAYDVSPDCRWAIHTYSRMDRPPVIDLVSLPEHKTLRSLQDNAPLRANVASLLDPPVEFLQLPLGEGPQAVEMDGWLMRPRNFDPAKKYPLIVYVYGEPAGTTVVDAWPGARGLFHRALAEEGYLIASFDTRGTPAPKGRAWRKSIYGAVGVLSAQDQTEAVQALARRRPYVDLARVGVWGWSGGGSNTLNLMFRSPDLFRTGVSVAPVPDQRLYDTIYQERYMGLPEENAEGYRIGSPITFASGLRGKLLLVHGTGDDNVHFQGTERLVNRLIELGKPFDFMAYPNRSHAISEGAGTSLHLHQLIARYFLEHLPPGAR